MSHDDKVRRRYESYGVFLNELVEILHAHHGDAMIATPNVSGNRTRLLIGCPSDEDAEACEAAMKGHHLSAIRMMAATSEPVPSDCEAMT